MLEWGYHRAQGVVLSSSHDPQRLLREHEDFTEGCQSKAGHQQLLTRASILTLPCPGHSEEYAPEHGPQSKAHQVVFRRPGSPGKL